MPVEDFYDEMTEQSLAKVSIVSKYFWIWAKVLAEQVRQKPNGKLAYVDLFAGPGRYTDGTKSTPLLILEKVIGDPLLSQLLLTEFNDADSANFQNLRKEIQSLVGIEGLKYQPKVWNFEIGPQIVDHFEKSRSLPPTLLFVDPFGYKGLSLRLVESVLAHWGCECIFFFNYNRVNMSLSNQIFRQNMGDIFGEERANQLRPKLEKLSPYKREIAIVNELTAALKEAGGKYILPFCFKNDVGTRTKHHLIFVTKHILGYTKMKEVMARESSQKEQGVASFTYCPADKSYPLLFGYARPVDDLADALLIDFAGQTLSMSQIFERHHVDTPYIKKNYKDALRSLEAEEKILTNPPSRKRKILKEQVSFGDNVLVTFPLKER